MQKKIENRGAMARTRADKPAHGESDHGIIVAGPDAHEREAKGSPPSAEPPRPAGKKPQDSREGS